tara:strand:- start:186 stop:386 length:201 start_codon:yes stop_codon:yes gene_type:complete
MSHKYQIFFQKQLGRMEDIPLVEEWFYSTYKPMMRRFAIGSFFFVLGNLNKVPSVASVMSEIQNPT